MRRTLFRLLWAGWLAATAQAAAPVEDTVREALAAEARLDTRRALELFRAAAAVRPDDAFLLQKIARQHSDLAVELTDSTERKTTLERALDYAQRAAALDQNHAESVLSVAICRGQLAAFGDIREKVSISRLVREDAARALALNPRYAWAHHVLGRWHLEVTNLGATARFFLKVFYGGLPPASLTEAVKHLEQAVALEPEQLAHHLELGLAYAAIGDSARARGAFETGLAMPSREKHHDLAKDRGRAALATLPQG
jgi:tetratricopeptide (TPR) repeat protein